MKINAKKKTRCGSRGGRKLLEGNVKTILVVVTGRLYNCTTSSLQQHPPIVSAPPTLKYCSESNANRKSLKLCCFNARAVSKKTSAIANFIISNNIDMCAITETWLPNHILLALLNELLPYGFIFVHEPRSARRGDGLEIIFKENITVKKQTLEESKFVNFECLNCTITLNEKSVFLWYYLQTTSF